MPHTTFLKKVILVVVGLAVQWVESVYLLHEVYSLPLALI